MPVVRFEGASYTLNEGESVLSGLLRHGVPVNYSCQAGVCGTCMMKVIGGAVPARAQSGIKDSWKSQGFFMTCVCVPEEDLELAALGSEFRFTAVIGSLKPLSNDVVQASLVPETPIDFRAGQYLTVVRQDGLARSYSVASLPGDSELQLHIRKVPNGRMSGWFHAEAQSGDRVTLLGPSGECFYVSGREDQPLLLVGTGTGLAPLYGIVRDALLQGHRGPIHLFHGALHKAGLYLVQELFELSRQYKQFHYTPAVLKGEKTDDGVEIGVMDQVVASRIPDPTGWRGFVCGDPGFVQDMKKKLFLAGIASRDLYADAFIPAGT